MGFSETPTGTGEATVGKGVERRVGVGEGPAVKRGTGVALLSSPPHAARISVSAKKLKNKAVNNQ